MTRYLVGSASIHTTAAACDYLEDRVEAGDTVTILTVTEPTIAERDGGDATNVARTRLPGVTVDGLVRDGNPAEQLRAVAREESVDELIVAPMRGDPEVAGAAPGSTTTKLVADPPVPVVVVPL